MPQANNLDKQISLFVTFQVVLLGVKNVLVQGNPFLFDINEKLNIIILAPISVLYVFAFIRSLPRKTNGALLIFNTFVFFSIIYTLLVFPQNIPSIQTIALKWIVVCFFTGFLICKLKTLEFLEKYMLRGSYILTLAGLLFAYMVYTIGHSTSSDWSTYSMSVSNVVLLASMWQLYAFFKKKNKFALLAAIVGIIVIFMYGSRNPFLALCCYVAIEVYDILWHSNSSIKKYAAIVFIIFIGLFAFQTRQLITFVDKSMNSMGFYSRTLTLIVNADTEDFSTGRNDIHKEVNALIWSRPITGNGICGAETNINELSHSFYLDIFVTHGVFIGAIFLITIIVLCLQALKKSNGLNHNILIIYLCLVFPRGFTGGDMWQNDVFWWLMGIVFMIMINSNNRNIHKWKALQLN